MDVLARSVNAIEQAAQDRGWDQPARLYALVDTAELLAREPQLASDLGADSPPGSLTPVEQEDLGEEPLDALLGRISWPEAVLGVAVVQEVLVLPPDVEATAPAEGDLTAWAAGQPDRRDVRLAVGVLRDGSRVSLLRVRGEDEVLSGPDLAPNLADALAATLEE